MSTVQDIGAVSSSAATSTKSQSSLGAAQDRFLKLLVTQMRNQDPLNPLDNAEVTSQLAQLSTVDGINQLNATMQSMSSMFTESRALQAAGLVGRGVLAEGSTLALDAQGALGGVALEDPVDELRVAIKDGSGTVVKELNLGPQASGISTFHWDGITTTGGTAAAGNYAYSVEAIRGGAKVPATQLSYATVGSVTMGSQGITVNTGELGNVALSSVKQIF